MVHKLLQVNHNSQVLCFFPVLLVLTDIWNFSRPVAQADQHTHLCNVYQVKKNQNHIEDFQPEWCISTINYDI